MIRCKPSGSSYIRYVVINTEQTLWCLFVGTNGKKYITLFILPKIPLSRWCKKIHQQNTGLRNPVAECTLILVTITDISDVIALGQEEHRPICTRNVNSTFISFKVGVPPLHLVLFLIESSLFSNYFKVPVILQQATVHMLVRVLLHLRIMNHLKVLAEGKRWRNGSRL